jgi:hypothetical protein
LGYSGVDLAKHSIEERKIVNVMGELLLAEWNLFEERMVDVVEISAMNVKFFCETCKEVGLAEDIRG